MAVDFILELEGITGESQDKDHKEKINISSWSWGMTQSGSTHHGTGSSSGKVHVQDISLTKLIDRSSVALVQYLTTGKHIPSGTLHCYKASGDNRVKYLEFKMTNILITSYQTGGSDGSDEQMDNFSLNFGEYNEKYTQQTAAGAAGKDVEFGWKISAGENA